ncbi:MAG: tRNA uridine-5-carboxymethylaminomethyl(34) synthesis GTPase MnmE [Lachnospiraceae bacterium]|nr:tRNA uridine-5-carboxymethylaminomethyl(34) synthesis GTPase MnmE [Lachnospiraceae bacterium]
MKTDTIAAIATAVSDSGIGIIRISGDEAIEIANRVYHSKNNRKRLVDVKSHTIHYGYIYDGDVLVDEVMVAVMHAPNTYTKEDTVEIDCHGGILVMNQILEVILKNGCRLAEPGEFTKRAFLNGRIDLSKAEAVMDIIHSKNEFALRSSVKQLKGSVSDKVRSLREDIIYEIAFIESALDDPEHISLDGYSDKLAEKASRIQGELRKLIDSADNGKMLKDGINTVIVGKPNAGKSSLLNLLVGEEKAIVTSVAGTTRDVLEESIKLHGVGLNMIDTAGIRNTEDEVEKIGVEKARKYAGNADLIVYVVDASCALDENDDEIMELIADKKVIVLLNKTDLEQVVSEDDIVKKMTQVSIIKTSAKENIGMDEFEETIKKLFFGGEIAVNDEIYITNQRHKEALMESYESMEMVLKSLADQMPEDFYSIDLMSAYASLGRIIGEEVGEDLVNEIFSKFCMGK